MKTYPLATVGALVVSPQARVLIVQTQKWRGRWGVPGGKIDYGESLCSALKREFKEETALDIFDISWALCQEACLSPEFYKEAHFILLNFIAKSSSEKVVLNDEAQNYAWVTAHEAKNYALNSYTQALIDFYLSVYLNVPSHSHTPLCP